MNKKTHYRFMSRWPDFVFGILLLVLIGVFIYARVNGGKVATQDGIMSRRAVPAVMFLDEPLNVEMRLDATNLPQCQANTTPPPPVYAIMVLDTSGSMSSALNDAKTAAIEFVDLLDLDTDRVGVIQFSDTASTLTSFGSTRENVVGAIERLSVQGGTNMGDGLQQSLQMIQATSMPSNTVRLVVLLSDGQPNAGPDPVQLSQQIRATGFRMTAVAMGSADVAYLQTLVDDPADVIQSGNSTDLINAFGQIAQRIVNSRATSIQLRETYNTDAFEFIEDSARGANAGPGQITWNWGFLGDRGRNTGYQLRPKQMGLARVVTSPGDMSLVDCNQQQNTQALPLGPDVVVLFPLWLLGLLAFLALLWGLYRLLEEIRFGRYVDAMPAPAKPNDYIRKPRLQPSNKGSAIGHWHGKKDI